MDILLKFKVEREGDYNLTARFMLGAYKVGEIPFSLHAAKPYPIMLISAVTIGIIAVIGAIVGLRRRKSKITSPHSEIRD